MYKMQELNPQRDHCLETQDHPLNRLEHPVYLEVEELLLVDRLKVVVYSVKNPRQALQHQQEGLDQLLK